MEFGVVAVWWLTFVLLILVGWPIAGRILRDSPDAGASLAAPAALAVLALPTLWIGQLSFDAGIIVGFLVLGGLSVFSLRPWLNENGWDEVKRDERGEISGSGRGGVTGSGYQRTGVPWREFAATLLVFSAAFGFMLVMRAAAPGIYPGGGEKFLDFGILQSLLRAEELPPQDMWFAGERLVYYYGGHMLAAILAKANGTPGVWAKAPALSGFYAIQVTAVYGLAQAIVSDWTSEEPDRSALEVRVGSALLVGAVGLWLFGVGLALIAVPVVFALLSLSCARPRRAGLFAAFMFAFASNLLTPLRLVAGHLSAETLGLAMSTFGPNRDLRPVITPESFSYWTSSRVIPDTINEFPLFAFRNGDLHAHSLSPTILLLLVGVLFALYRTPEVERRRRALLLASTLPLAAIILTINVWSFPTALGLIALGIAGAPAPVWTIHERSASWNPHRDIDEVARVLLGVVFVGAIAALTIGLVWPFVENVLLAGVGDRHPGFLPTRSGLGPFVIVHGVFLAAFASYIVARGTGTRRGVAGAIALVPLLLFAGWEFNLVGLALVGPLVVGGWWLLRTERGGFEALLLVAGGGLVVLVEFAYLVDNAAPERFNTVFKVYYQVWTLWAVALGVVLASFTGRVGDTAPTWRIASVSDSLDVVRRAAGPLAVIFLVVTTSMYGGLVVKQHIGGADEYSLDAMTFAHTQHPDEAAAIEWIQDLDGQPTFVSMPCTAVYSWCNPESSLTGVPTVLGWGHEAVYRGGEAYRSRQLVVSVLYDTEDPYSRAVLLKKYDVKYIYVGPRERAEYDTIDYAAEPGISVAYANDNVVIYAVEQSELTKSPE